MVLKFDRETERVSLGYKQLQADPWTTATLKYPAGARIKGKVVSITDYGAFVELEQGIEGLIHVSEMSWSKKVKHPSKILVVGQEVECQVLGIDQEAHRISLGLKQVESNPWMQLVEKYPVSSKIKGKVRNLTEFGAFVEVEEGIDGLIHISDLSWTKRIKHPSELLKKGDVVEAIVLNIDAENQRLSLGLKQLATDIWDEFFSHHKVGDIVEGKIVRLTNFGAFVELAEGIEGLVHVSELDEKRIEKPEEHFKPGDTYPMKIIKVQEGEKKIGLSVKAVKQDEFQRDLASYRESQPSDRLTLGDAFRAAQAAAEKESRRSSSPMTKAELVDEVSRISDLTRKHSEVIVEAVFSSIVLALQKGDKIELRGFGSFRVRRRDSRTGRNPKTGAGVVVPAKRIPHFKPGKELRELINRH